MSPRIVLYSSEICPWAQRARIALVASGAEHEIVEINLQDKPIWYASKINPASKVPALSFGAPEGSDVSAPPEDTFLLPESGLIVSFITSLYPTIDYRDPVTRAKASLSSLQWDQLIAPYTRIFQLGGTEEALESLIKGVKTWASTIPEEVLGAEYGVFDILVAPHIIRLVLLSKEEAKHVPSGHGAKFQAALSEPGVEKFLRLFEKVHSWSATRGSYDEKFLLDQFVIRQEKRWEGLKGQ